MKVCFGFVESILQGTRKEPERVRLIWFHTQAYTATRATDPVIARHQELKPGQQHGTLEGSLPYHYLIGSGCKYLGKWLLMRVSLASQTDGQTYGWTNGRADGWMIDSTSLLN